METSKLPLFRAAGVSVTTAAVAGLLAFGLSGQKRTPRELITSGRILVGSHTMSDTEHVRQLQSPGIQCRGHLCGAGVLVAAGAAL
jgi:hypothetical protein